MEPKIGKIGIREFVAISILMIGLKLTDDTPAIFFKPLLNAAWMTPIISGVIAIIPIYILMKVVTLYKGKNLMEVINQLLGKYIGFFVLLLLWIISAAALIIDTAIYTDVIRTMYFVKTPTLVIYTVLMAICVYGAKKGLEQIGSVAWAILPYVKLSLFIILTLTIWKGQTDFLFPLFGPGEWPVIKESALKISIYGDFLFLFLLVPYIKSTKEFKKGTWIALLLIIVELTIAMVAYILLFDYTSAKLLNYPYHETLRYIDIGFLRNVESFFFPFWLLASFVRFSIYLYINVLLFGGIFKVKNFDYVIPTIATLIVFIGMIPDTPTFTIFSLREILLNIVTPTFFFLPFLLLIIAKLKGDFKNGNP